MTTSTRPVPFNVMPSEHDRVLRLHWDITTPVDEWEAWVLIQSDEHMDSKHCRRDILRDHHEQALRRHAAIIKVGDTFDVMQGPGDRRGAKDALKDEYARADYFDAVEDDAAQFYAPFAQNIVAVGTGNHEDSVTKYYGVDLAKRLARRLRSEGGPARSMGYDFWVWFTFQRDQQRVSRKGYFFHGSGGGGPVTKDQIQASRQFERLGDVDLICTGHTHDSWSDKQPRESLNKLGAPEVKTARYIKVGNYKERGHWETTKGMPHKPIGAWWLRFTFRGGALRMNVLETEQDEGY